MVHVVVVLLTLLWSVASKVSSLPQRLDSVEDANTFRSEAHKTSHIFNAVHSSMRQWGSSWNHNGMSFFMATVPAGIDLYHGSSRGPEAVKGTEWLAFEPEHAINFAMFTWGNHFRGPPSRPPPPKPDASEQDQIQPPLPAQVPLHVLEGKAEKSHDQWPLPPPPPREDMDPGWFHTYRTKHDLSLLYLDGLSAGKSGLGTMDSQDYILLNWAPNDDSERPPDFREAERAKGLCDMAKTRWHERIDGFIRAEMGFEVILCDFEKNVDLIDVVRARCPADLPPVSPVYSEMFAWYRSVATRFDGIGGDRVRLDHDHFVTAYAYDDMDIFPDGPDSLPRARYLGAAQLDRIRSDIDDMIFGYNHHGHHDGPHKKHRKPPSSPQSPPPPPPPPPPSPPHAQSQVPPLHGPEPHPSRPRPRPHQRPKHFKSINWQAIADMIVARYSTTLPYLASLANSSDPMMLQNATELLMRPFIDFSNRSLSDEIDRCTRLFIPATPPLPPSPPPHPHHPPPPHHDHPPPPPHHGYPPPPPPPPHHDHPPPPPPHHDHPPPPLPPPGRDHPPPPPHHDHSPPPFPLPPAVPPPSSEETTQNPSSNPDPLNRPPPHHQPHPPHPQNPNPNHNLAKHSIHQTSNQICKTLISILHQDHNTNNLTPSTSSLKHLIHLLNWSTWRQCPQKCSNDQVCFIPIWPLGSKKDRLRGTGKCVNSTELVDWSRDDYWNN